MAVPEKCTYDLTIAEDGEPPRRPGLDDVGGGYKEDDQDYPPNPATDPCAADENQQERLLERAHRMLPVVSLSVHVSGGVPTIAQVATMIDGVTGSTFTPTAPGATGTTVIAWPSGTMPAKTKDAVAVATGTMTGIVVADQSGSTVTVRGSDTDLNYVLDIYGE